MAGLLLSLAHATEYDLVIRNARIVDGTGNAWIRGDIGVKNGIVSAVGVIESTALAAREIDAAERFVAPGFIDIHTHCEGDLLNRHNPRAFTHGRYHDRHGQLRRILPQHW